MHDVPVSQNEMLSLQGDLIVTEMPSVTCFACGGRVLLKHVFCEFVYAGQQGARNKKERLAFPEVSCKKCDVVLATDLARNALDRVSASRFEVVRDENLQLLQTH